MPHKFKSKGCFERLCYGEKREQEEKTEGKRENKIVVSGMWKKGTKKGRKGGEKDKKKKKKKKKGLQKSERGEKG